MAKEKGTDDGGRKTGPGEAPNKPTLIPKVPMLAAIGEILTNHPKVVAVVIVVLFLVAIAASCPTS